MTRFLKKEAGLQGLELPRRRVGLKRLLERSRKAAENACFTE